MLSVSLQSAADQGPRTDEHRVQIRYGGEKSWAAQEHWVGRDRDPTDGPDFARLYSRRNDAESINRNIEDTLWIGRAHSIGHARQLLNLLGYALMVNGLALHRHQRRRTQLAA